MTDFLDTEGAPPPPSGATVRAYGPYEVVRINLRVAREPYRGVVRAHYDSPDGRRAYRLTLWPRPDAAPNGWYWWDAVRMTRRDYRRPQS
ncbi:hypothetical protein FNH09_08385 [Streptomyces adustus]|uniref:Uncharacterized protein n=1 Tax=Streptomyces adustus TaxID=1609272 RepID=A0A5N8V8T9_9ACTN|nr:hypothetical protein [Streptomyces adustus]MPY31316.1 hypothetical protein [Streptomyces adustus]